MKQPFSYQGSKSNHLDLILPMFPEHDGFVEVFGGSAVVLLNKKKSSVEIFNDLDSNVYNFFKVLRDKPDELVEKLLLTPYSREEYINNIQKLPQLDVSEDVEKARCWYMVQATSFSGRYGAGIRAVNDKDTFRDKPSSYNRCIKSLHTFAERFQPVFIENKDFSELIEKYDKPSAFFYLDPPYISETKHSSTIYDEEMKREDHERLVETLLNIDGKALMSCYDDEVYEELVLNGWKRQTYNKQSSMHLTNSMRTETIYFNYDPMIQDRLF